MPSTHLSLHYHIIFSTKERRRLIRDEWRDRLHQYLGGCVKTAGGIPEIIGGVSDHEELNVRLFSWQDGYGAFTVSSSMRERVRNYIAGQEEHHRRVDFREEYLKILELHDVEYDEQYLW